MKAVGIIVEYNPFHNGHLYHLKQTRKMYKDHIIIAVMSGNFSQRGEASIIDKQTKTEIALKYKIDLIIELPFHYATQSADLFAKGAIEILKELKVDTIVFGSESNNVDMLYDYAKKIIKNKEYEKLISDRIDNGNNYASSSLNALKTITNNEINTPNDILGIAYIKEIIKQKANIKPITIQRTNDYQSKTVEKISSATSIREALQNNKSIKGSVPRFTYKHLKNYLHFTNDYFDLLKYKILSSSDLSIYQGVDEGIENRIIKCILKSNSLEELILNIKTKRYTYNRISRMLTHILIGFTKLENIEYKNINYIRVLGFNKKGQKYLNSIKKDINIPIITNYAKNKKLLKLDYRATCIYASKLNNIDKIALIKNELNKPIIK